MQAAPSQRAVAQFPLGTQDFHAWYLILHGGIKLVLPGMLWPRLLWAFPAAMLVLGGFVSCEGYGFLHSHASFLLMLSFFDLSMIALIWQEYQACKRNRLPKLELA